MTKSENPISDLWEPEWGLEYCPKCNQMTNHDDNGCLKCRSRLEATENNLGTVDSQSDETRLTGELSKIVTTYTKAVISMCSGNKPDVSDDAKRLKTKILAWHETEKQKYAMAYADEIVGNDMATHHDHPFLSDYSMSKIRITINDMILYDKTQHFTKETKEWFENTINEAVDKQLQQKCNNEIRKKQRELNKSKGGKI